MREASEVAFEGPLLFQRACVILEVEVEGEETLAGLSNKQRVFLENYLTCWVGTKAARAAGYLRPVRAAGDLLRQPKIQEALQERLAELRMGSDEVLVRLTQQARGEHMEYLQPDGAFDLVRLLADGRGHLIKTVRRDRFDNLHIEFYDAQAALALLGRHLALFKETKELDVGGALAQILERLADAGSAKDR